MRTSIHEQPHAGRKVLVLGDDYRMVLPIVRSLGRAGIEVHLAWCPAGSPACASRHAAKQHDLPWYCSTQQHWVVALNALAEQEAFDLVIPATEHAVHALQSNRDQLTPNVLFYLLDDEAFQGVANKSATYDICQQEGIPYPRTLAIDHIDQFSAAADELRNEIVVKPSCSVTMDATYQKAYVRCCRSHDEARSYTAHLLEQGVAVTLQQQVAGEGVGVELLVNEGKLLTALQHRRLHETKGYGSTYRETAPLDDRLLAACGRLMAALKYTGVAMVEFRVDPETNDWSLIEVNGRFWGSLPLAAAAGIDFPLHLFELLVVGQTKFSQDYRTGVRSRALTNDLRWMWRRMTKGQTACPINDANQQGWAINQVPLRHVAQAIVRGMTFRDHVDTFSSSDIWPAISELRQLGIAVQVSLRSRMPMLWGRLLGCTFHRNRHHDRRGAVGAFD